MKNVLIALLLALSFMSCEKEDSGSNQDDATILGRWVPEGFEDAIRYEFTADKKFTLYSTDGSFPTLEEFMTENPGLTGNDWSYEGQTVVVDLNFGNYSRLIPVFNCDNEVINWIQEDGGADHSTYYREGHDITDCN